MKKVLLITQVVNTALMLSIVMVVNIQKDYPYMVVAALVIVGIAGFILQGCIQRKIKKVLSNSK